MMDAVRRRLTVRTPYPEGGYVLITTLVAMLVCTLLVTTMLSIVRTPIPVEETGRQRERQARAAESALELAINEIRNNPNIASSEPLLQKKECNDGYDPDLPWSEQPLKTPLDAACPNPPDDQAYSAARDPLVNRAAINGACNPLGELVQVDGYPVRVYCYNQGLQSNDGLGGADLPPIPRDDGALAVKLVGDTYVGDPVGTSADPITDVARTWNTGGFPFNGILSSSQIAATDGQLVHTGAVPLQTIGGVMVRNQIAGVTSSGTPGPALDAKGWVRQGGPGLGVAASTDPEACGVAQVSGGSVSRAAVSVRSNVVVPNDKMLCNQGDAGSLAQGGTLPPGGDWTFADVVAERYVDWDSAPDGNGTKTVYGNSNIYDANRFRYANPIVYDPWLDCGTYGDVISIPQGSYDKEATRVLNDWFSGESCNNKTYVFEGGVYHFDVYDPSRPANDPRRHSLVFGDRTSNWIFGTPTYPGFASSNRPNVEDFPNVCDRNNASSPPAENMNGASIYLSSRTGLHHTGGRVAICGEIGTAGGHNTAIFQRPARSLGARLLPTSLTAAGWTDAAGAAPAADGSQLRETDGTTIRRELVVPQKCWDDGTCTSTSELTATFASGAVNGEASPGTVSTFQVDLVANGGSNVENPLENLASTRFDVTLGNGTTCDMTYGPDPDYRPRVPSNNAFTTYDLKVDPTNGSANDGVDGNCDTVLGSTLDRAAVYNSTIKVTFTLNPPKLKNTKFDYLDSLPWPLDVIAKAAAKLVCDVLLPAWNSIAGGISDFLNDAIDFVTGNPGAIDLLADIYNTCDDRPLTVAYQVDAMALRTGWSPQIVDPIDWPATQGVTNPVSVGNAPNGTAATPNLYATTSITAAQTRAESRLRYTLRDPNLEDGFLPLDTVDFRWKIDKPNTGVKAGDRVVFTLKTTAGVWCTRSIALSDVADDTPQSFNQLMKMRVNDGPNTSWQETSGDPRTANGNGRCQRINGSDGPWTTPTATSNVPVDVGELVTHWDDTEVGSRAEVKAYLDVEVILDNTAPANARTVGIDWVSFSATAGDRTSSGLTGYPRPKDPFTVTWSPRTYDGPQGPTFGRAGDATFNVWGPVSVPNNDVRVIWNYGPNMLGQVGYPIFNAGRRPFKACSPTQLEGCQPALVASALGSWTTGSWPSPVATNQLPDPLAGTGDSRPAFRKVRLVACVVDESGANDQLLPRANAQVLIADRSGKAFVPGVEVITDDWDVLRSEAFRVSDPTSSDPLKVNAATEGACNPRG